MVMTLIERARGTLMGLAVGDALGGPTEGKSREEIVARWGRVNDFLTDDQAGSDDTEYALFTAKLLTEYGRDMKSADVARAWRVNIIKGSNAYKGAGFSEMMTIHNLQSGLEPPASGQHLHSWSDGLAMRVAPFGIVAAGDPSFAAHLAGEDGAVSHAGEGIYSGQAVAAGVAAAMGGSTIDQMLNAALDVLPRDSWTASAIEESWEIGTTSPDVWRALEPLRAATVCSYYYWSDIAPEAVGLAFGLVAAARGRFEDAVLGGVNIGRDSDTIAAIAGAICGAAQGITVIPERWRNRVTTSKGVCIAAVKDMSVILTADELAGLAESWRKHR